MEKINLLAVAGTTVIAIIMSSFYYTLFGKLRMKYMDDPTALADMKKVKPWKIIFEFLRSIIIIYIFSYFFAKFGILQFTEALRFAILLWIAFPVFLLSGSVLWDKRPWQLAAIHSGDWLLKLFLIAFLLHLWPK